MIFGKRGAEVFGSGEAVVCADRDVLGRAGLLWHGHVDLAHVDLDEWPDVISLEHAAEGEVRFVDVLDLFGRQWLASELRTKALGVPVYPAVEALRVARYARLTPLGPT